MRDLDSRPVRAPRVLAQASGPTLILLDPDSGECYTLDEVGARIWDLCDGTRPVADVVALLHADFDAPIAAIQADVLELLDDLARDALIAAG